MRKLFLILCIAFVVVCYGYPCLILPFGSYKAETTILGIKYETEYKFSFNGKVKKISNGVETEYFYKLKGNEVILSDDKKFDDNDDKLTISSIYKVDGAVNQLGMYVAIGVGVAALVLVLTIPSNRD